MNSSKGINHDDTEMKEMWSFVAGSSDSQLGEEAKTGQITKNKSVYPAKRNKEDKTQKNPEEIAAMIVEQLMAIFEVACEDDIVLNTESKPCINKLKKLPLLIQSLSKKHLQNVFIDHGIFTLLKNWLEPLPDGSLPNFNIRQAILLILTDQLKFDVNQEFVKEQLKKSGLGKVIMFLSQTDEETASNQKLAKDLVYKWSRSIFNISTRFEDARATNDERINKRPCIRKPTKKVPVAQDDAFELEIYEFSSGHRKTSKSNLRSRAQLPEATSMNFVISPPSKVDKNKFNVGNERHDNIMKKLRQLKARNLASQRVKFAY